MISRDSEAERLSKLLPYQQVKNARLTGLVAFISMDVTKESALTPLLQKRSQRFARLINGNDTIQMTTIAFQGFKGHVAAAFIQAEAANVVL
ncbi:hypothetical protein [Vreelandella massiliensis]|uniref:hypothetical protein n=1 Tax=Vreelandella massiliensis TaxID=1816686 RepID=UPI0013564B3C|nr:hypothetical protein [Halomonas massiliensis]